MVDTYRGVAKSVWARSKVLLIMMANATLPLPMKPADLLVVQGSPIQDS